MQKGPVCAHGYMCCPTSQLCLDAGSHAWIFCTLTMWQHISCVCLFALHRSSSSCLNGGFLCQVFMPLIPSLASTVPSWVISIVVLLSTCSCV